MVCAGLQSKCGSAFSQLASTSCVREDLRATAAGPVDGKGSLKAAVLREKPRLVRLHAANVLSMDVVMTTGLEVGSHASDCWRHVFRCVKGDLPSGFAECFKKFFQILNDLLLMEYVMKNSVFI